MGDTLIGLDLFARHTDVNGRTHVHCHRVHDKETFIWTRMREVEQLNEKQKPGDPRLAKFEQITEERYLTERKK